ncbi:MAG: VIT1/CCC1 transporter family protein [Anaerolineae bacterium]
MKALDPDHRAGGLDGGRRIDGAWAGDFGASSRGLYHHQIAIEARELEQIPAEEEEELKLIYQSKGLAEDSATRLAHDLVTDQSTALDTLAREELGIDPQELGGSAWEAAITSFFLFAVGAIIPVAPFALLTGMTAVIVSLVASGLALFGIGALITLMTDAAIHCIRAGVS